MQKHTEQYYSSAFKIRLLGLDDEKAAHELVKMLRANGLKVSFHTLPLRLLIAANINPSITAKESIKEAKHKEAPIPSSEGIKSALKPIKGGKNGNIDYTLYDSGKAAKVSYDKLLTSFKKEYKRAPNRKERRLMLKLANNSNDIKTAWKVEQYKNGNIKRSESVNGGIAADNDLSAYDNVLRKAPVLRSTLWSKHK